MYVGPASEVFSPPAVCAVPPGITFAGARGFGGSAFRSTIDLESSDMVGRETGCWYDAGEWNWAFIGRFFESRYGAGFAVATGAFGVGGRCWSLTFWWCGIGPKISSIHDSTICARPHFVAENQFAGKGIACNTLQRVALDICRSTSALQHSQSLRTTRSLPIAGSPSLLSFRHTYDTLFCIVLIISI